MTLEQLDEIEKLAAAATPGPWIWRGPDEPADLWTADGKDPILCVQTANTDIRFIRAMREHALPLVKALREAKASVLHWRTQWAVMAELANQNLREKLHAESERDEARAEVERLREVVRQVYAAWGV